MHISSCLHPRTIVNPYTGKLQTVSCGICAACRNHKASIWVQRLDQERYCWKYCWFFTLTYSPEHVPRLKQSIDILYPTDNSHVAPNSHTPIVDLSDVYSRISSKQEKKCREFLRLHPEIYYTSVYDVQCFIKRVRITLDRLHKNTEINLTNEKDSKIRYFVCSEYGPKGRPPRPHYHGLFFFNSPLTAARIHQVISSCWKFGFVNSSPVAETNSRYVAAYLNSTSHLPKIYESKYIRPFILFSKSPAIGSLVKSTEEVRQIFDSCNPSFVIQNHKKSMFENVPLWRFYQDSLFPKLSYFSELSHADRITLYGMFRTINEKYPEVGSAEFYYLCKDALSGVKNVVSLHSTWLDYAKTLSKTDTPYPFQRWFNISSRVCEQARSFGISIKDYIEHIERFYSNADYYNIKQMFHFEEGWSDKYPIENLIGIDDLFLKSLKDIPLELLSYQEILILQSYNIDFDKFFSNDAQVRYEYYDSLYFKNTQDFAVFTIDSEVIRRNNCKTKEKNETINPNIFGEF